MHRQSSLSESHVASSTELRWMHHDAASMACIMQYPTNGDGQHRSAIARASTQVWTGSSGSPWEHLMPCHAMFKVCHKVHDFDCNHVWCCPLNSDTQIHTQQAKQAAKYIDEFYQTGVRACLKHMRAIIRSISTPSFAGLILFSRHMHYIRQQSQQEGAAPAPGNICIP